MGLRVKWDEDIPPTQALSLAGRISRGGLASLLHLILTAFYQIALIPMFLHSWGRIVYGEWLTLTAAVSYMSILDFGLQIYVGNKLTEHFSKKENSEYNRTLHSALFISFAGVAVASLLALLIAFWVPLVEIFHLGKISAASARTIILLFSMQLIVQIPVTVIVVIYRTVGEYSRGLMLGNVSRLVLLLALAVGLYCGVEPVTVALLHIIPVAIVFSFSFWDLTRRYPQIEISTRTRDVGLALSFLPPSFLFFLIQVANGLYLQFSTLAVSRLCGAATVTTFVTSRTLVNLIRQVCINVNHLVWTEVTYLSASGKSDELRELHLVFVKSTTFITVCGIAFLWYGGEIIFETWTHGVAFDRPLCIALFVLILLQAPWTSSSVILNATNTHQIVAVCATISCFIGTVASFLFGAYFGAPGVVYGYVLSEFFICFMIIPLKACQMLGESIFRYIFETCIRGLLVSAILYLALLVFQEYFPPIRNSAFGIVAYLSLLFLVVAVIGTGSFVSIWLSSGERMRLLSGLTTVFKRVKAG